MPINRNALIRYKTIDRMLRGGQTATLQELIDSCSDALLDYCGQANVSKRTIQHDLQEMRYSEALGYYAPIEVVDKKYYMYSRRGYSITKMPLSQDDMVQLSEAVDVLKQMSAFSGFDGVEDVVNRLEDHVASMRFKADQVILLESNERLRGLKYITPLHDAIFRKMPIMITYKSFNSEVPSTFIFSPYILKEFRNRWFVFGNRHGLFDKQSESSVAERNKPTTHNSLPEFAKNVTNLALDRIEKVDIAPVTEKFILVPSFKPSEYFRDMIGVTRNEESRVEHVLFRATNDDVPYIQTKPLHHSQKEVERHEDGSVTFSIDVILNRELERDLLGHGHRITVLAPPQLVDRMKEELETAVSNYK